MKGKNKLHWSHFGKLNRGTQVVNNCSDQLTFLILSPELAYLETKNKGMATQECSSRILYQVSNISQIIWQNILENLTTSMLFILSWGQSHVVTGRGRSADCSSRVPPVYSSAESATESSVKFAFLIIFWFKIDVRLNFCGSWRWLAIPNKVLLWSSIFPIKVLCVCVSQSAPAEHKG